MMPSIPRQTDTHQGIKNTDKIRMKKIKVLTGMSLSYTQED